MSLPATQTRAYLFSWADILGLQNILRATSVIAGALHRQAVLESLNKTIKAMTESERAERAKDPETPFAGFVFNREELGAIKLALIELWIVKGASGAQRELVREVARLLSIWRDHVLPNLPKDDPEALAISGFDDEVDILQSTENPDDPVKTE